MTSFPGVRFLSMARDIALSRHERYDGTGYPKGLKGREIPLSGRIVAVADVTTPLCRNACTRVPLRTTLRGVRSSANRAATSTRPPSKRFWPTKSSSPH